MKQGSFFAPALLRSIKRSIMVKKQKKIALVKLMEKTTIKLHFSSNSNVNRYVVWKVLSGDFKYILQRLTTSDMKKSRLKNFLSSTKQKFAGLKNIDLVGL